MTYQHIDVRRDGPVERVTLNRPDVRNAFNDAMIGELAEWTRQAASDHHIRVAVLAGAGKAFCAGADVTWMARTCGYSEDENLRDARAMAAMFGALDTLRFPLIARIHGAALGGGTGLAAVCDIVVASEDSTFGFTEVKLGIVPAVISPFALGKIGVAAARELMLTGVRFPAARAREVGLVHHVVPPAALDRTVDELVREVLDAAPGAVALVKRLIPQVAGRAPRDVAELTAATIAAQRVSPEGQEGLTAFLEKRRPNWSV